MRVKTITNPKLVTKKIGGGYKLYVRDGGAIVPIHFYDGEEAESGFGDVISNPDFIVKIINGKASLFVRDGKVIRLIKNCVNSNLYYTNNTITNHNPNFSVRVINGVVKLFISDNGNEKPLKINTIKWYGVEVDESNLDPEAAVTRTGNMDYHASLPIQSGMKRCVLNADGTVNYYLDAEDSTKKADGTAATLDGTDGDIMVEIPTHYILVEKEDTTLGVKMSTEPIEGFVEVPLHYISAYQATDDNGELKSLSGTGATGSKTIGYFRESATAKNTNGVTGWSQMTYDYTVDLYWLFLVEYANRNSQAAVNNSLTKEGYRQGGLGMGCTYVDGIYALPVVTNGATNSLGNNSGEITGVTPLSGSGTATVNSYRGIENPFGNLYTFYDGIVNIFGNIYRASDIADYKSLFYEKTPTTTMDYTVGEVVVTPDGEDDYLYYLCVAPSTAGDLLSDDTKFEPTDMAILGYTLDATYTSNKFGGYMSAVNNGNSPLGSILASAVDGTKSTGYCDYFGGDAASLGCVYGGGYACGSAGDAPNFGLACVIANGIYFGGAVANIGSRLCYRRNNA